MKDSGPVLTALAEALIAAAGDGLVAVDRTGSVVVFNDAAGQIFGLDPAQLLGCSLEPLFPPGLYRKHQQNITDYFAGSGRGVVGTTLELEGWHADGRAVPIEISLSSTTVGDEPLVMASIRDISARKEAERQQQRLMQQLLQAQKMEALGTLAAGIAHDFNTNLQTIMGYVSAMLNELEPAGRHHHDLSQVMAAVLQARRLTKKLLTFSQEADERAEVMSLNAAVRDMVTVLRRTMPKNISIQTKLSAGVHTKGDPIWLQHALMNLGLNARDAMPDGGELYINTRLVMLDQQQAAQLDLAPGEYCMLNVQDTGEGIPPEVLGRVFDSFYSTKPRDKGSGLGLSMVQTTIQGHGGRVCVTSEPGQGAKFTIYLPSSPEEIPAEHRTPTRGMPYSLGSGELVLLVDDEKLLLEMGQRLLEKLGYRAVVAENGEQAVNLYRQHQEQVALVILDVILVGVSGAETLKRLRELNGDLKVLVSSGFGRDSEPKLLLDMGADGFLQKPYGIEEISRAICKVLK